MIKNVVPEVDAHFASNDGTLTDITHPNAPVEVLVSADKTKLWVNVGSRCVLRICQIRSLSIVKGDGT